MTTALLGDVVEIVSGATPKTAVTEYWNGDIPWVTPADLGKLRSATIEDTPRKLTKQGLDSCGSRLLPPGSVLLSSRAPIGHVAINTVPMATNQGFKSLVPGSKLEAKYLYHWVRANRPYLESLGNGATFKELSKKTVEQIEIPLPSIDEQRRIAAILDQADAIRAKRQHLLAHLDDLTQSIFHTMFGDPDTGWKSLADAATFYSGGTPSKQNADNWTGKQPWFSAKDLKAPDLFDSRDHISETIPAGTSLRLLPVDTIAIVVRGMILAHTVPVSVLRVPSTINQDLKAVLPRDPTDVDFLAAAIRARSPWILARMSTAGHGTKKLDASVLATVPIPAARRAEQIEFGQRVRTLSQHRARNLIIHSHGDELFDALQTRFFQVASSIVG